MFLSLEKRNLIVNILAALIIFLFVYTAIDKLMNLDSFKVVLEKSPLLHSFSEMLAVMIPVTEICISGLLFFQFSRVLGFLLSTILMGLFTIYIGYMILFIPKLPCSCGGIIQQMNWTQHLIFNTVFSFLSFLGWRMSKKITQDFIAINRQSRTPV